MPTITSILARVIPKLQKIEEHPMIVISRMSAKVTSNPFQGQKNEVYDVNIEMPCVFSSLPEIVKAAGNMTTIEQNYFYFLTTEIIAAETKYSPDNVTGTITFKDRFIFQGHRYVPTSIDNTFGLWKIKADKE